MTLCVAANSFLYCSKVASTRKLISVVYGCKGGNGNVYILQKFVSQGMLKYTSDLGFSVV